MSDVQPHKIDRHRALHTGCLVLVLVSCSRIWAVPVLVPTATYMPEQYVRGNALSIEIAINGSLDGEVANSLGLEIAMPSGWRFVGVDNVSTPLQITPPVGDEDLFEFAFAGQIATLPQTIAFTVITSPRSLGTKTLDATAIGVFSISSVVSGMEGLTLDADPIGEIHALDINADNVVALEELLRLIQFFNTTGGFQCDALSNDGFAPGSDNRTCLVHSADYADQDWTITFSELLRGIQLFNLGGYIACEAGEDGFCAGETK